MPNYKISYVFKGGDQGFSETFYYTTSSITVAHAKALSLIEPRQGCLGIGAILQAVRTSNVDILNDSKVTFFGKDQTVYAAARDVIGAAVLLRIEATDKSRRMFWMRGVPDSWINIDQATGENVLPAAAGNAILAFTVALSKPSAFQLFAFDKTGQGGIGVQVGGPPVADGAYTQFPVTALTAIVGNQVLMRKWKGPDSSVLNLTYDVVKVTNASVTLNLLFANLTDPAHDFGGYLYPRNKGYIDITSGQYERAGIKRAGRAFFVPRGRRRVPR